MFLNDCEKKRRKQKSMQKYFSTTFIGTRHLMNINIYFLNRSGDTTETNLSGAPTVKDEIIRLPFIKISAKVKGLCLVMGRSGELRVS